MAILVVDDNEHFLRALELSLSARGVEITGMSDIAATLEFVEENDVRLAVSDYFMPGMNGPDLLSEIGKIRPDCQLLLTSSYPVRHRSLSGPGVPFIQKSELPGFIRKKFCYLRV
jgi:DNA-binding NtrC family response regulator